jgi:hypothetical protein
MKKFLSAFVVLAAIFAITGCPTEPEKKKTTKVTAVGAVTVTYNGGTVATTGTTGTGPTINVGEQTAEFSPSADKADTFIFQSSNAGIVSVQGRRLTGVGAGNATITCSASNKSGGAASAQFTVTVRPKLTGFDVIRGAQSVDPTNSWRTGDEISLHVQVTPATAENKFAWSSTPAGLSITDNPAQAGGKIIKSTTDTTYSITVTPDQAGLSDAEKANLKKTFSATFSALALNPVTTLNINQGTTPVTAAIPLKRGRSVTLTAVPDVTAGTTVTWEIPGGSIITKTENGFSATLTAADGDAGGEITVTVKARNDDNTADISRQITISVPARGSTLFEWYADENPDETGLGDNAVRNYPGFRDVYIQSRGATLPFNMKDGITNGGALAVGTNLPGFKGIRLGTWFDHNVATPTQRHPRLMIGAAVTGTGDTAVAASNADTGTGNTNVGTLDLSKPVKITVDFDDYAYTAGSQWIRFYVNNNTSTTGNSNLGNASQFQHYNTGTTTIRYFEEDCVIEPDSKKGTYSYLLNYDAPTNYAGSNTAQITEAQRAHLTKAFLGIVVQNVATANAFINITGIKLEYVAQAGIEINRDADFDGFPIAPFTLTATETKTITLTGNYPDATWYINGESVGGPGKSYTVDANDLDAGTYSLTVIIKANGQLYSKSVKFTVEG